MSNKKALQILVKVAEKEAGQDNPGVVYTTEELKQAIYRVNKHIKFEVS